MVVSIMLTKVAQTNVEQMQNFQASYLYFKTYLGSLKHFEVIILL